jgi:hypothetical protein
MDKSLILEILYDWNFWKKPQETGKERKGYLSRCLTLSKSNVVVAIIGIRRAGKSYLIRQIANRLISDTQRPQDTLIINLEDQRFTQFYPELLQEIFEVYLENLHPSKIPYIFLDEVHNIQRWERWVRTMHELGKAKIFISGSSSKLLSSELSTLLTGRHLDLYVYPLNFIEFLSFKDVVIEDRLDIVSKRVDIKRLFKEYMEWGGFPEVVLSENKRLLLLSYFDDIITRDIEKRYSIKKGELLRTLARFYLTNVGRYITFNSIRRFLNTATITIERFSSYLEEASLIFFVRRFSHSIKEQEKSPRKVYAADIGMANAIGFKFSENWGRLLENLVAIELKRRQDFDPNLEVYYWRHNNKEVDFVIKEGLNVVELFQVCWDIDDFEVRRREIKPLLAAMERFDLRQGMVITQDYEYEEKIDDKTLRYIPIWRWLAEELEER